MTLQTVLYSLQEEQARLKMRLQELQQLKRERTGSPGAKWLIGCYNKRNTELT